MNKKLFLFILIIASNVLAKSESVVIDSQQKNVVTVVSLEEASFSQGIVDGSHVRINYKGIDFKEYQAAVEKIYAEDVDPDGYNKALRDVSLIEPGNINKDFSKLARTEKKRASFNVGIFKAYEGRKYLIELNVSSYMNGFKQAYAGEKLDSRSINKESVKVREYRRHKLEEIAADRLVVSHDFLKQNKTKKGVVTTKSGLQYEVLDKGEGELPTELDIVVVNFDHTVLNKENHIDGKASMHIREVPDGWRELFLLMKKGARYRVYLPPEIGFGGVELDNFLLPNELLISEFELVDIIPPPPVVQ